LPLARNRLHLPIEKHFFFEKKKQKTFVMLSRAVAAE
jgi:hypothetical protein